MICRLSQRSIERMNGPENQPGFLRSHQADCPECQALINRNATIDRQLNQFVGHDADLPGSVSHSLHQRVMRGVQAVEHSESMSADVNRTRWRPLLALASAALIAVIVLLSAYTPLPEPDSGAPAIVNQDNDGNPVMPAFLGQNLPQLNPLNQELALRQEIELLKQDLNRFNWRERSTEKQPG